MQGVMGHSQSAVGLSGTVAGCGRDGSAHARHFCERILEPAGGGPVGRPAHRCRYLARRHDRGRRGVSRRLCSRFLCPFHEGAGADRLGTGHRHVGQLCACRTVCSLRIPDPDPACHDRHDADDLRHRSDRPLSRPGVCSRFRSMWSRRSIAIQHVRRKPG